MVVADRSEQPGLCLETAGSRKFSPEGTHPARLNLDHDRRFTDAIDACVIAHFGKATGVAPRPLPDQATQQLADLSPASARTLIRVALSGSVTHSRIKECIGR